MDLNAEMTTPQSATGAVPPVFAALHFEVSRLHFSWQLYTQLFTTPESIEVLRRGARTAFRLFQESLARSMELAISRLTDRASNQSQGNVSLHRLPALLDELGKPEVAGKARVRLQELEAKTALIRLWRNKRTAHYDLKVALGEKSLEPLSWPLVDDAVTAIRELFQCVEPHIYAEDRTTGFEYTILDGDGEELLALLKMGHAHYDCLREARGLPRREREA